VSAPKATAGSLPGVEARPLFIMLVRSGFLLFLHQCQCGYYVHGGFEANIIGITRVISVIGAISVIGVVRVIWVIRVVRAIRVARIIRFIRVIRVIRVVRVVSYCCFQANSIWVRRFSVVSIEKASETSEKHVKNSPGTF
jgi:hypothetical protein